MEDMEYSSINFRNKPPPRRGNREEIQTVYSSVIRRPTSDPRAPKGRSGVEQVEQVEQQGDSVVLMVLTVVMVLLLLGCIAVITYLAVTLTTRSSEVQRLTSEVSVLQNRTQRLTEESVRLKGTTAELQNLTLGLNWTLEVVLSFSQFPVSDYCPRGQCEPCLDGWLHFQSSCYFIYNEDQWRTWDQSRTFCRDHSPVTDLLTISSQQEQEFVHDHLEFYFDIYHGFWIGLSQQNGTWVWVDGTNDSLRFWMEKPLGQPGPKALMIPQQNVTTSWSQAENIMRNKFICESRALTLN